MNSHLSKARSCAWYEKGKLRALGLDNLDDFYIPAPSQPHNPEDGSDLENHDPQQDFDLNIDMDFGPYEGEVNFLPPDEPEAGPGPQTAANWILQGAAKRMHPILDDDDDE